MSANPLEPMLRDYVLLVTGAAGGIGRAVARAAADAGARVALLDRDAEAVAETANALAGALSLTADVSDERAVEQAVARVVECFGRIDGLCHAAGTEGASALAHELDPGEWRRVLEINLTGAFIVQRAVVRAMLAADEPGPRPAALATPRGAIVHLSSVLGRVGAPGAAAYAASKHGLIGLVRSSALELARRGIRVNAICPGFVATPMLERLGVMEGQDGRDGVDPAVIARHPMGRIAQPEEIAQLVLWLLSPAASFLTGEAVAVDGGYLAR